MHNTGGGEGNIRDDDEVKPRKTTKGSGLFGRHLPKTYQLTWTFGAKAR